jgi:hypothetical protein
MPVFQKATLTMSKFLNADGTAILIEQGGVNIVVEPGHPLWLSLSGGDPDQFSPPETSATPCPADQVRLALDRAGLIGSIRAMTQVEIDALFLAAMAI